MTRRANSWLMVASAPEDGQGCIVVLSTGLDTWVQQDLVVRNGVERRGKAERAVHGPWHSAAICALLTLSC
jgi:hypothetical protein